MRCLTNTNLGDDGRHHENVCGPRDDLTPLAAAIAASPQPKSDILHRCYRSSARRYSCKRPGQPRLRFRRRPTRRDDTSLLQRSWPRRLPYHDAL